MMVVMIKAVIFDCFGVLTVDTWREFMAGYDGGVRAILRDATAGYDKGLISEAELIATCAEAAGIDEEVVAKAIEPRSDKNAILLDYAVNLKAKGIKIGLLSNINDDWVRQKFLNNEEQKIFDEILLSYEVGEVKPKPGPYIEIVQRLALEPAECVMVDDVDRNCYGAESVGMKSVLFESTDQAIRAINDLIERE